MSPKKDSGKKSAKKRRRFAPPTITVHGKLNGEAAAFSTLY